MSQLKMLIADDISSRIVDMYNSLRPDDEFEFVLGSNRIGQDKYTQLLRYLKLLGQKYSITEPQKTMDISFNDGDVSYRMTIRGLKYIDRFLNRVKTIPNKNFLIVRFVLASLAKADSDENYSINSKQRKRDNIIDVPDLDLRVRSSRETYLFDQLKDEEFLNRLMNTLSHTRDNNIFYRYKERVTLYLDRTGPSDYTRIDITSVKGSKDLNRLLNLNWMYEVEVESKQSRETINRLDLMMEYTEKIIKIIQQSNFITTSSVKHSVIDWYKGLLSVRENSTLTMRNPLSLEIQHVTDTLPDRYAVTDKADGERRFLVVMNTSVYFIGSNLDVTDTGIQLEGDVAKVYSGTILDGELIFVPEQNRHVFLVFDCLRTGGTDVRRETKLETRLDHADRVIKDCFVFDGQDGFTSEELDGNFDMERVLAHHEDQITRYCETLMHDIVLGTRYPLIRRKYFISCLGIKRWEIFSYASLLWRMLTENSKIRLPYQLDGLVFHPLEQAYITDINESKLSEYKWKPPEKNSIDFYVVFRRDLETGKLLSVYDNSVDEYVKNKTYKICNLFVGRQVNGKEQPVPFGEEEGLHEAYIFEEGDDVRDKDGEILGDKTVVEFYYNNKPDVPYKFRWVPIRVRYDKTDSVARFGKRYGNYFNVANKVWRSIINPILIGDFIELGRGGQVFDKKMKELRSKIEHKLIISSAKENKYYQVQNKLMAPMRSFDNWIKSNIIYTHCHPMYQKGRQLSVLDLGCGKGGDNMKFYYATVDFYVGIDINTDNLTSPIDGALSRYNQMRKSHPNFPKMYFIQGDAAAVLQYDSQIKAVAGMTEENRKLMQKFFDGAGTLFDRINCQFAIHYFLRDDMSWNNFKTNINRCLRAGGYMMVTTFDGEKVTEVLRETDKYSVRYNDSSGEEKLLFEIIKRYDDGDLDRGIGLPIDFHGSWMFTEGNYVTEYIVNKDFLEKELLDYCDLELVDTGTFNDYYNMHRDFFSTYASFEENVKTRKFFTDVAMYYEDNEVNRASFKFTALQRYYVFRKKDGVQSGGTKPLMSDDMSLAVMKDYDKRYSFVKSLQTVLARHKIIPHSLDMKEFMTDLGCKMSPDSRVTMDYQNDVCKRMIIDHEVEKGGQVQNKRVLNGLGIYIIERNCNDQYELIDSINSDAKKFIILARDGDSYCPAFRTADSKVIGLFDKNTYDITKFD